MVKPIIGWLSFLSYSSLIPQSTNLSLLFEKNVTFNIEILLKWKYKHSTNMYTKHKSNFVAMIIWWCFWTISLLYIFLVNNWRFYISPPNLRFLFILIHLKVWKLCTTILFSLFHPFVCSFNFYSQLHTFYLRNRKYSNYLFSSLNNPFI